jgi:hypothetical protein
VPLQQGQPRLPRHIHHAPSSAHLPPRVPRDYYKHLTCRQFTPGLTARLCRPNRTGSRATHVRPRPPAPSILCAVPATMPGDRNNHDKWVTWPIRPSGQRRGSADLCACFRRGPHSLLPLSGLLLLLRSDVNGSPAKTKRPTLSLTHGAHRSRPYALAPQRSPLVSLP